MQHPSRVGDALSNAINPSTPPFGFDRSAFCAGVFCGIYGCLSLRCYDVVLCCGAMLRCYAAVFWCCVVGPNARVAPVDRENKLFVGMLPHDADDMTLTEVFSGFGEITEVSPFTVRM